MQFPQSIRSHLKTLSDRAAFLGDAKFPQHGMKSNIGAQIYLISALYEQYSALNFTKYTDKAIAISGMEQRLTRKFGMQSGAGVFDNYKGRWLMWERADDVPSLKRVEFPETAIMRTPPSWSFMAYEGAITYFPMPTSWFTWNRRVRLVLPGDAKTMWLYADQAPELRAHILILTEEAAAKVAAVNGLPMSRAERIQNEIYIMYDIPEATEELIRTFVVVGTVSVMKDFGKTHFVLAVKTVETDAGVVYERIGAGWLPDSLLDGAVEYVRDAAVI